MTNMAWNETSVLQEAKLSDGSDPQCTSRVQISTERQRYSLFKSIVAGSSPRLLVTMF